MWILTKKGYIVSMKINLIINHCFASNIHKFKLKCNKTSVEMKIIAHLGSFLTAYFSVIFSEIFKWPNEKWRFIFSCLMIQVMKYVEDKNHNFMPEDYLHPHV
jgi:hypothetical protein